MTIASLSPSLPCPRSRAAQASAAPLQGSPPEPQDGLAEARQQLLALPTASTPAASAGELTRLGAQATAQAALAAVGPAALPLTQPLRMVLVGPPGSGKGTQAHILSVAYQVPHISTGDLLRQEVAQGTPLGKEAEKYMNAGQLVPDSIILQVVDNRLEKENGFILDGFPRSTPQAEHLDETLARLGKPLHTVSLLEVDDEVIVKRLLARGRKDDTEEVIRARLKVYHEQTEPVLTHYDAQNKVDRVNGDATVEKVAHAVVRGIEARLP